MPPPVTSSQPSQDERRAAVARRRAGAGKVATRVEGSGSDQRLTGPHVGGWATRDARTVRPISAARRRFSRRSASPRAPAPGPGPGRPTPTPIGTAAWRGPATTTSETHAGPSHPEAAGVRQPRLGRVAPRAATGPGRPWSVCPTLPHPIVATPWSDVGTTRSTYAPLRTTRPCLANSARSLLASPDGLACRAWWGVRPSRERSRTPSREGRRRWPSAVEVGGGLAEVRRGQGGDLEPDVSLAVGAGEVEVPAAGLAEAVAHAPLVAGAEIAAAAVRLRPPVESLVGPVGARWPWRSGRPYRSCATRPSACRRRRRATGCGRAARGAADRLSSSRGPPGCRRPRSARPAGSPPGRVADRREGPPRWPSERSWRSWP